MSIREVHVPGGYGQSFEVSKGEYIKVTDVEGQQVADLIAINLNNMKEYLSTAQTRIMIGKLSVGKGDALYSNYKNKLFEIVEDTVGVHDTLYPCCDRERYVQGFGVKNHRNCRENFAEVLNQYGIDYSRVPGPVNFFQNTPVNADGTFADFMEPQSKAGDYVILRALADVVIGISACPMDLTPLNAWNITDIQATVSTDIELLK